MANPEHLQILHRGVEAWNAWQEQHRDLRPNLRGANLVKADLPGANLHDADLYKADLMGASLMGASLMGASLPDADLRQAKLMEANLREAKLIEANLTGADLMGADLMGASLMGANLTGASLSQVQLSQTIFAYANLTAVRGLETCRHVAPSILDLLTIKRSGPLPLAFLRGCGLPDALIDYLPSLLNEPFQFYSCFISYSRADEDFCRRLHGRLQDAGLRVWFAPHDIQGGRKLHEQIDQAIRVYDKLLLVLSPHSMHKPRQNIIYLSAELNRLCRMRVSTYISIHDLSPVRSLTLPLYSVVAHRNATSRVQSI